MKSPSSLTIFLRVESRCSLGSAVPEKSLHHLWPRLSLVDSQLLSQTEVMKAEVPAFLDGYPDTDSRHPQMVGY
ncbi:hypothetical protein [Tunturiibacter lichenicola]|uniref:hypothetical protein n=1 Tax=Tunturiibacter lichenicola TaxID=2051959 RepID=UPI0021B494C4|nr:hypothetical protein [Edaphobacter lichenicola]